MSNCCICKNNIIKYAVSQTCSYECFKKCLNPDDSNYQKRLYDILFEYEMNCISTKEYFKKKEFLDYVNKK